MVQDTMSTATTSASRAGAKAAERGGAGSAVKSGLRGMSFADQIQMLAPAAAMRRPVQREEGEGDEGRTYKGVPVKKKMCEVCHPPGPSPVTNWGLPEPLLVRWGADLPVVDVLPGAARIVLSTPYGSASLGTDGKFKLGLKQGAIGGSVDSGGTVSGAVQVGPFKVGAESGGQATLSMSGVKLTYDVASGDVSAEFTPELSWGPAKVEISRLANGIALKYVLGIDLTNGWSIAIEQDQQMIVTTTPDEAQQAIRDVTVDPFFDYVSGGVNTLSGLIESLQTY